jgi:hypothetical protein
VEGDIEEIDGEETGLSNVREGSSCSKRGAVESFNFGLATLPTGSTIRIGAFDNVSSCNLGLGWLELLSGTTIANIKTPRVSATTVLVCRLSTCIFLDSIQIP